MPESFWTTQHIEIIGLIILPLALMWLDLRKQANDNKKEVENNRIAIEKRFTALETMIKPLWDWFTNGRN